MRWIFLVVFVCSFCEAGSPPFSDLQRRPSLSPYMRYADGMFTPLNVDERSETKRDGLIEYGSAERKIREDGVNHECLTPRQGIRPTGHPTHFMYIPYYRL